MINPERLTEDVRTRLSASQRSRIQAAALRTRQSSSDFVREAALLRAEQVLAGNQSAKEDLQHFIGILDLPVTRSVRTGKELTEILKRKQSKQ